MNTTNILANLFFRFFAFSFNHRPALNRYLESDFGPLDFTFGIRTENDSVRQSLRFENRRVTVLKKWPEHLDAQLIFMDESVVKEAATRPPNELMLTLMENRMVTRGNLGYLQLFNFYLSLLLKGIQVNKLKKETRRQNRDYDRDRAAETSLKAKKTMLLSADKKDPGVRFLEDPYLSGYSLGDFPRLKNFLNVHLSERAAICHERPLLLTEWYRENGFETDRDGNPVAAGLRQARAFKYLMENRQPIIRKNDLVAGTTTAREVGVVIYPDAHGTMIWGELITAPYRPLNPYDVDKETIDILHHKVFPFWLHRNFREWVRENKDYPLCQKLDERFAACFLWKTVALSHSIINYPKILAMGTSGIMAEIDHELEKTPADDREKKDTLAAMKL